MNLLKNVATLSAIFVLMVGCGDSNSDNEVDCLGDAVCAGCVEDDRPPWCYSAVAEEQEDPDMCDNITTYWGEDAAPVGAYCIYEIAKATKNCSLCSRIDDSQIRSMCDDDC